MDLLHPGGAGSPARSTHCAVFFCALSWYSQFSEAGGTDGCSLLAGSMRAVGTLRHRAFEFIPYRLLLLPALAAGFSLQSPTVCGSQPTLDPACQLLDSPQPHPCLHQGELSCFEGALWFLFACYTRSEGQPPICRTHIGRSSRQQRCLLFFKRTCPYLEFMFSLTSKA